MNAYQIEHRAWKTGVWRKLPERPYASRDEAEAERRLWWSEQEARVVEIAEVYSWEPREFLGAQA